MDRQRTRLLWRAAAAAALLIAASQPAVAQGLWQTLFGPGQSAPSRVPAARAGTDTPAYSAHEPPGSPFGSLLAPLEPQRDGAGWRDDGSYRTLCVRMCDGFYFPISHAATWAALPRDAETCAASCGSEARLFYYPNPGGDIETMLDLTGRAYASYPIAFRYRKTLVKGCQCRLAPWSESERARHRAYAVAAAGPSQVAGGREPELPSAHQHARLPESRPVDQGDTDVPAQSIAASRAAVEAQARPLGRARSAANGSRLLQWPRPFNEGTMRSRYLEPRAR